MNQTVLFDLLTRDTQLKKVGPNEYAGPCPLCQCGTDRFHVWPNEGRWSCLGYEHGRAGCSKGGDAIQYIRERDNVGYVEACEILGMQPAPAYGHPAYSTCPSQPLPPESNTVVPLQPPSQQWQDQGWQLVLDCQLRLMESEEGKRAKVWLNQKRGLSDEILWQHGLGYNPVDRHDARADWGLSGNKKVWVPRGIVIPWYISRDLWRINIRRPVGEPKYIGPTGFSNALYNADRVQLGKPVVLVEGEIDALTVEQYASDLVTAVATGSTAGSRRAKWIAKLAMASVVLVAYDVDANGAGDKAATWWLNTLPNAQRWRPLWADANTMATDGVDIRAWVKAGIEVSRV